MTNWKPIKTRKASAGNDDLVKKVFTPDTLSKHDHFDFKNCFRRIVSMVTKKTLKIPKTHPLFVIEALM